MLISSTNETASPHGTFKRTITTHPVTIENQQNHGKRKTTVTNASSESISKISDQRHHQVTEF
jgi:hypothetical protein